MSTEATTNLAPIVQRYIQLRDRKGELKKAFDASVADIDAALDKIENFLLKTMSAQGVDSLNTAYGTPYIQLRTNASVADWDETLNFIRGQELWGMLERRVAKGFVEQYRAEHGELPPGINWTETRVVNVRRS